jgi:hypothetical protein
MLVDEREIPSNNRSAVGGTSKNGAVDSISHMLLKRERKGRAALTLWVVNLARRVGIVDGSDKVGSH